MCEGGGGGGVAVLVFPLENVGVLPNGGRGPASCQTIKMNSLCFLSTVARVGQAWNKLPNNLRLCYKNYNQRLKSKNNI